MHLHLDPMNRVRPHWIGGPNQFAGRAQSKIWLTALLGLLTGGLGDLSAQPAVASAGSGEQEPALYVTEYRIRGSSVLDSSTIERAVYPYLGPGRSLQDIEQARQALEKAYHDRGYQTVQVQLPEQDGTGGIVFLNVVERPVGRLRVRKSRYFLPSEVKKNAPSLSEGRVANFEEVKRDLLRLNQWPDRQIKPELKDGVAPDTVDVDLVVKDSFPLHGSLELNNRYSPDTSPLRLNGYLAYTDLLQMGHTLGLNFQISPDDLKEVKVFSAYYLARVPEWETTSLMVTGTIQDSNVSTLGGTAVAGRGKMASVSSIFTLPASEHFLHSLRLGLDFKHFDQDLSFGGESTKSPVDYFPLTVDYTANWVREHRETAFHAAVTASPRGLGSSPAQFDTRRYGATGGFIHLRGDLTHQRDLPGDFHFMAKIQGQAADSPLIDPEQITGGGLNSVRGYLESEAVGDHGFFGSLELASPSLVHVQRGGKGQDEGDSVAEPLAVQLFTFLEGGKLWLRDPLPSQIDEYALASYGFGTRVSLNETLHGSIDLGSPLIDLDRSKAGDWRLTFRVWGEF